MHRSGITIATCNHAKGFSNLYAGLIFNVPMMQAKLHSYTMHFKMYRLRLLPSCPASTANRACAHTFVHIDVDISLLCRASRCISKETAACKTVSQVVRLVSEAQSNRYVHPMLQVNEERTDAMK